MDYTINPYNSLGSISLGLPRDQIRSLFKESYIEFYRNQFSKGPTDFYEVLGLLLEYDERLCCEAIEIVQPASPTLFTVQLLALSYKSVEEQLAEWDEHLEINNTGFISYKFGISAYAPEKDDSPDGTMESVILFKKGYYDGEN